jgi:hypothetical protein
MFHVCKLFSFVCNCVFVLVVLIEFVCSRIPNQNVSESYKLGKSSCTGLSIILVNACRSVGIPSRCVCCD